MLQFHLGFQANIELDFDIICESTTDFLLLDYTAKIGYSELIVELEERSVYMLQIQTNDNIFMFTFSTYGENCLDLFILDEETIYILAEQ